MSGDLINQISWCFHISTSDEPNESDSSKEIKSALGGKLLHLTVDGRMFYMLKQQTFPLCAWWRVGDIIISEKRTRGGLFSTPFQGRTTTMIKMTMRVIMMTMGKGAIIMHVLLHPPVGNLRGSYGQWALRGVTQHESCTDVLSVQSSGQWPGKTTSVQMDCLRQTKDVHPQTHHTTTHHKPTKVLHFYANKLPFYTCFVK